jgi:two-component system response regulator QseB
MKILLVEDDLALGKALHRSLQQHEFDCVWVRRLSDARFQLTEFDAKAIILDINLPDGEGFSLLSELRAAQQSLPVIIMTARDELDDRLRGLDQGADDYICKPFPVEELIARLRAVLRRAAGHFSERWKIGSLVVEPALRKVSVGGNEVELLRSEYDLLLELATKPGAVVQKWQLVANLSRLDEEVSENALEVRIHSLRKKLGGDTIRTVRGVGYLLESGPAK